MPARARGRCRGRPAPRDGQGGSVLVGVPVMLALVGMLTVVLLELGGQLVAISRASALADAAALAAVAADADPGDGSPRLAAERVVRAGGGHLEDCGCPPGTADAEVAVSVEVPGIATPRLGAGRQLARSRAVLVHDGPRLRGR